MKNTLYALLMASGLAACSSGAPTLDQVDIPAGFRFETLRASVIGKDPQLAAVLDAHVISQLNVFTADGVPLFTGSPSLLDTKLDVVVPVGSPRILIDLVSDARVFSFEAEVSADGSVRVIGEERS